MKSAQEVVDKKLISKWLSWDKKMDVTLNQEEAKVLIASIQNGEVATKEPLYAQNAITHEEADWGTTYVEVVLRKRPDSKGIH